MSMEFILLGGSVMRVREVPGFSRTMTMWPYSRGDRRWTDGEKIYGGPDDDVLNDNSAQRAASQFCREHGDDFCVFQRRIDNENPYLDIVSFNSSNIPSDFDDIVDVQHNSQTNSEEPLLQAGLVSKLRDADHRGARRDVLKWAFTVLIPVGAVAGGVGVGALAFRALQEPGWIELQPWR